MEHDCCRIGMIRYLSITVGVFLLFTCRGADDSFTLQNGDLLFSVGSGNSNMLAAIQNSTSKKEEIPFSHVGIVTVWHDTICVIEADSPEGVVRSTLEEFFADAASLKGKKLVAVGRLKPGLQYAIPSALEAATQLLGREYDYLYDESNDTYYCSELVRKVFRDSLGNNLFAPQAMSFTNKETGETDPYWTEHFRKRGRTVPEGAPGTNPADMAQSENIDIVHVYY